MDTKAQIQAIHKTTLRTVLAGSAISTIGGLGLKLVLVLSTLVTLRYVEIFDYGLWKLVLGVVGFALTLGVPRLESVFIADLSRELGRGNREMYRAMLIKISILVSLLGVFSSAVLFVAGPFVLTASGVNLTEVLRLMAAAILLVAIERLYLIVFQSHLEFWKIEAYKFVGRIAGFVLLVVFIFNFNLSIFALALAYLFSTLVPLIIFTPAFIQIVKRYTGLNKEQFDLFAVFKAHGKWAILSSVVENLTISARPWIIAYFVGIEAMAIVTVALTIFSEIANLVPLHSVLAPIVPREVDEPRRMRIIFDRGIKYSIWLFSGVGILFLFLGPFLVQSVFPQYEDSTSYLRFLVLLLPFFPINYMTTHVFYAFKAQKDLFKSTLFARGTGILLVLPTALYLLGPSGAVFSYFFTTITLALLRLVYLKKINSDLTLRFRGLFQTTPDDRVLLRRITSGMQKKIRSLFA